MSSGNDQEAFTGSPSKLRPSAGLAVLPTSSSCFVRALNRLSKDSNLPCFLTNIKTESAEIFEFGNSSLNAFS